MPFQTTLKKSLNHEIIRHFKERRNYQGFTLKLQNPLFWKAPFDYLEIQKNKECHHCPWILKSKPKEFAA